MRLSFYVLVLSFLAGVMWRSLVPVGVSGVLALLVCAAVVFVLARVRQNQMLLYVTLVLVAVSVGMVRTQYAYMQYDEARVFADGALFVGEGVVAAEPDEREGYTVLWVDATASSSNAVVRLRVKVPPYPSHTYGDRVALSGMLVMPRAFVTETGRVFHYSEFLMKDHVHYVLERPIVKQVSHSEGNPVVAILLEAKHTWLSAVSQLVPEPSASLAGGVIVGAKRSLGEDWLELFRITGLIHIVVLSGYNLTLVANAIVRMTGRLPRLTGLVLGVVGVVLFALMTGAGPTVVRASLMAIIGMLAVHIARPLVVLRLLAFAGFLMVLWNPFVLAFDPGFQLSFVATLGLVVGSPVLSRFMTRVPDALQLREIVAATFATQLAVLPLLLYHIGLVSVVAPLTNVLVLPLVPFAMLVGFLTGVVGLVSTVAAAPLAWVSHGIFSYIFAVVESLARLPFASVELPVVSWWVVCIMYLLLAYGGWHAHTATQNV